MEINLSGRFKRLRPALDDFSGEIKSKSGKLCLVSIADGYSGSSKFSHRDGEYDFVTLTPDDSNHCSAQTLSSDGSMKEIKFNYSESGILVPEDDLGFKIENPGPYRLLHRALSCNPARAKKVLKAMVGEYVIINDNFPDDNSVYSTRRIELCDGDNEYTASVINSKGETKSAGFLYKDIAGLMIPERMITHEFVHRIRID